MSTDALKEKLKELHNSMGASEAPDAELVKLLQMLEADIHALIAKNEGGTVDTAGLATRTQTISAQFAAQHPRLEPALRELTDMLASIGI